MGTTIHVRSSGSCKHTHKCGQNTKLSDLIHTNNNKGINYFIMCLEMVLHLMVEVLKAVVNISLEGGLVYLTTELDIPVAP